MRFLRYSTTAAAVALAMAGSANVTAAQQADVCTSLEAQLASLDQGAAAGSVTTYRQYDASVSRQRVELDRATAEARRAGCMGGFLIFQPKPEAKCGALMATINRMQANLQRLISTRDRYSTDPFEISKRRSEVLRALAANQCGNDHAMGGGTPPSSGGDFFDLLFGRARIRTLNDGYYGQNGQFGTYRTLCVRKCDGYYFPISFSTVPGRFAADEQTCQSMCPGSDVSLYVYHNPGEDPSQMVSLAGERYTALPTAFRYRQEYDAACTCRAPVATALTRIAAPTNLTPVSAAPTVILPKPVLRTVPGEDPETAANRAADFAPEPVVASKGSDAKMAAGSKHIRIVGPSYYYGQ